MAAVVMFGAVACSQYDEQEVVEGQEVTTTFAIGLENLGTRVAGDSGMIDKVAWGIYEHQADGNGRFLAVHSSANPEKGPADFDGEKAEIEVTLFTGKLYDLVFFGYCSANNAYSIDWEKRELNVSYENDYANLEARDAFVNVTNGWQSGVHSTKFTLTRPFAQLNVGQSMEDYNIMQLTGNCIEKSAVKVKAYKKMSLINKEGEVIGDPVEVDLYTNDVVADNLNVGGIDYKHIAMNYLLVNKKAVVPEVLFFFWENDPAQTGKPTMFIRRYYNVPLQRNYRTNILGRIISDEYNFEIKIDARFAEPDNDVFHAFQHGGVVNLPSDMKVGHPLVVRSGVEAVLNLNGHTLKNYIKNEPTDLIVVEEGATLTINGNGTLEAVSGNDGYTVISEGTVIINGGTFKAGLDKNGEANAVVYARGNGKVFVNGGYFPNEKNSNYVLNKKDADKATTVIEVSGGVFVGFDPSNSPSENPKENFLAEGCIVLNEDNVYTVVSGAIVKTADEFKAAKDNANLQYMVIAEDIDLGTAYTTISTNKVILGNGHSIKAGGATTKNYGLGVQAKVNVEINDIVMNGGGGIYVSNGANVTINNVVLKVKYSASGRHMFYVTNATLTVNSGNFEVLNTGYKYFSMQNNARAYVKGGTFEDLMAKGQEPVLTETGAALEITGGKFQVGTTNYAFNPEQWVPAGYKVERVGNYKEVSKQ